MKIAFAVLALLWSLAVHAQGLNAFPPGGSGGKVLVSLPFATVGCFASGTGGVSITRVTASTYWDGSATQTCAAGSYRVEADGLLVEPARSNFVLSSTTHPKTDEATASIGTGLFQARHQGTGTMTLVAGTATVTGLSCSGVAAGTVCTGTVTVAGTLTITTTEGTTRAQVETGAFPTSWIDNASAVAAAARNADQVYIANPIATGTPNWCVSATAKPSTARQWSLAYLWTLGDGSQNNNGYYALVATTNKNRMLIKDGSAVNNIIDETSAHSYAAGESHRFTGCAVGQVMSMATDGTLVAVSRSGAGTLSITMPAAMGIGISGTSAALPLGGYIKNFKVCKAKKPSECN